VHEREVREVQEIVGHQPRAGSGLGGGQLEQFKSGLGGFFDVGQIDEWALGRDEDHPESLDDPRRAAQARVPGHCGTWAERGNFDATPRCVEAPSVVCAAQDITLSSAERKGSETVRATIEERDDLTCRPKDYVRLS